MSQIGAKEIKYTPDKVFSYNSAFTFTGDLENLLKVATHPKPQSYVYEK